MVLAGLPKSVTDNLQWMLNSAACACLFSGTYKCDHCLTQLLYADLHWLSVADRVWYKLAVTVYQCLHNRAQRSLADCCIAVSDIATHHHQLDIPRGQCSTLGRQAFSVARSTMWNSLPDKLRDPSCADETF